MSELDVDEYASSSTFSILKTIEDLTKVNQEPKNSTPSDQNDNLSNTVIHQPTTEPTKRVCKNCGVELAKNNKYRLQCIKCYNKEYADTHKEKFREYHRLKYLANKSHILREAKKTRDTFKARKLREVIPSKDGRCIECGVFVPKLLLKTFCKRCYQREYHKSYRPNADNLTDVEKPESNDIPGASSFEYLVNAINVDSKDEQQDVNKTVDNKSAQLPTAVKIDEVQTQKECKDCGKTLSFQTTVGRCRLCNKNHHRRESRKRVRGRVLAQNQHACTTCGLLFNSTSSEADVKCPDCTTKNTKVESKNIETNDGIDLLCYLSTLATGNEISTISKKPSTRPTGVSRGNCEDCGEVLPVRGYLMKCRRCNKKAYKRMLRVRKREAKLGNVPSLERDLNREKFNSADSNAKFGQDTEPKILESLIKPSTSTGSHNIRQCAECSTPLHVLSRGTLCRRCNKKAYKREARRRKREERLAESSKNDDCETSSLSNSPTRQVIQSSADYLNGMIGLFNDDNCATDEEENPYNSRLIDHLID